MVTLRITRDDTAVLDVSDAYESLRDMDPSIAAAYSGLLDSQTKKLRTASQDGVRMGSDSPLDAVWEIDPGTPFAAKTTVRSQLEAAGRTIHKSMKKQSNMSQEIPLGPSPADAAAELFAKFQQFMAATTTSAAAQASMPTVALPAPVTVTELNTPPVRVTFTNQLGDEIETEYAAVLVEPLVLVLVSDVAAKQRYTPKNPENALTVRIHNSEEDPVYVARPTGVSFEHNGFSYCLLAVVEA